MIKAIYLTTLALLAFAGNSILCRFALGELSIDAVSFTSIRLFSGALFLLFVVRVTSKTPLNIVRGSWSGACFLFIYAITFSFAYISLDTGTGALILFGFVQATMITFSLLKGEKLSMAQWIGLVVALVGLVILLLPGASAPSLSGFMLMAVSGMAWAFYTIIGKSSTTPLADTTSNFVKTLPFVAVVTLLSLSSMKITNQGIALAALSGALTSGLGYAIWYAALREITVTQAAIFQLLVPIIATVAGVLFFKEVITPNLTIASASILGGILIFIIRKEQQLI